MCGIAGFTGNSNSQLLRSMASIMLHRGPDGEGYYETNDINLGHRRLSIIDLETGNQPIFNEDKTIVTIFNGEIYNYLELRNELIAKGHVFHSKSDTEVIVHSYEEYGEDFLKKFNGEFAIALWDDREKKLVLARDRLGIKPLYYTELDNQIIFASEIKAILKYPGVSTDLDPSAIDNYLRQRYVSDSVCLFKNIKKLKPATMLIHKNKKSMTIKYWNIEIIENHKQNENDIVEQFYELLNDSVRIRLRSDVEVGAYLSGGLDSSVIAALTTKINAGLKTFCIGFGSEIDELEKASKVSSLINANFFSSVIESSDFDLLPKIIWHLDEPIGDAIIIPTYFLSQYASRNVKVVLSGEGADEVLGGYIHHFILNYGKKLSALFSPGLFKFLSKTAITISPGFVIDHFFPYPASPGKQGKNRFLDYIDTIESIPQSYLKLSSLFTEKERAGLYKPDFYGMLENDKNNSLKAELSSKNNAFFDHILRYDIEHWLPENQLHRIDKLSMANSIEARVPFLDHRIVEFCFKIPESLKMSFSQNKILLRNIASKILPREVYTQKKQAFYFPLDKVFKGNFSEYARDIILDKNNFISQIISYNALIKMLDNYENNSILASKQVMAILILELWGSTYYSKVRKKVKAK